MFKLQLNFFDSFSSETKVKAIIIGFLFLVYALVLFFLPAPQNPIVSLQLLEEHIWGSSAGSPPSQLSDAWSYATIPFGFLVLALFANFTIDLLATGNKLQSAFGICLAIGLVVTPLLFGLGSNVFSEPIGILVCLIASLFAAVAALILLILASFLFSKEDKFFKEIKNDFIAGIEAERAKAPTE